MHLRQLLTCHLTRFVNVMWVQNSFRSYYNLFRFLRIQVEQHTWPFPINYLSDCSNATRSVFFSERVINVWNSLPCDVTNFSSVKAFNVPQISLASALALFRMCLCIVFFLLGILYCRAVLITIMLVSLSCLMLAYTWLTFLGVKTYSDPSYIFSCGQDLRNSPGSTRLDNHCIVDTL